MTTDDGENAVAGDGEDAGDGDGTAAGDADRSPVDRLLLAIGGVGLAALSVGLFLGPPLHAPGDGLLGLVGLGSFADDANALGVGGGLVLLLAALLRGRAGAERPDADRPDD